MAGFYKVTNTSGGPVAYGNSGNELSPGTSKTFWLSDEDFASVSAAKLKVAEDEDATHADDFNGVSHSREEADKLAQEKKDRAKAHAKENKEAAKMAKENEGKENDGGTPTANTDKTVIGGPGVGVNSGPGTTGASAGSGGPVVSGQGGAGAAGGVDKTVIGGPGVGVNSGPGTTTPETGNNTTGKESTDSGKSASKSK